jgi:hypothetical protein
MAKLTLRVTEFRPLRRNTLCGFVTVRVAEMRLTIRDITIHQKGADVWAQLPARPQLDPDGNTLRDRNTGKISYATLMEFDDRATRDAFAPAVVAALAEFDPAALGGAAHVA